METGRIVTREEVFDAINSAQTEAEYVNVMRMVSEFVATNPPDLEISARARMINDYLSAHRIRWWRDE